MLERGAEINQRYRIVKLLGQGGFGSVYRAWDIALKKPVAVKENLDVSAEAQRQFEREATTLANLRHRHLPSVTDHFILPEQGQYLVMDFVDGEDLEQIILQRGMIAETQAIAWIRPIADALTYLHTLPNPVIHRDIKPANIIIDKENEPYLVDFGLVKVSSQQINTTIGARSITPGYAPPEQYGSGGTDARSDLYALGATLYTLLTGIRPPESVQRLANDRLTPAHIANPQVSEHVSLAISQAMALSPANRFESVAAFQHALDHPNSRPVTPTVYMPAMQPVQPHPISQPVPPAKKRNRLALIGGIAALILVVGSFVFALPRFIESQRGEAVAEVAATLTQSAENAAATQTIIETTETKQAAGTQTALELTGDVGDIETATAVAAVTQIAEATLSAETTLTAIAVADAAAAVDAANAATSTAIASATAQAIVAADEASATETAAAEMTATTVALDLLATADAATAQSATAQAISIQQTSDAQASQAAIATQNAISTINARNAAGTVNAQNAIATRNAQNAAGTTNARNVAGTTNARNAAATVNAQSAIATRNAQNALGTTNAQNAAATRNAQNAAGTTNAQNAIATQTAQAQAAANWSATQTAEAQPPAIVGIRINNNSGSTVCSVNISPTSSTTWGEDVTGGQSIAPGQTQTFDYAPGSYDFRASDCNGFVLKVGFSVTVSGFMTWSINTGASLLVVNNSGSAICRLYISLNRVDTWGTDLLGPNLLAAGSQQTFFLNPALYDLLATDCDGNTIASFFGASIQGSMRWNIE